ncbi:unnamed protein product [Rodentolepis nana]|uniref:Rick_17kDa_Anti domain-containing protein n=1 Tax=Rodentolepis nana TaxID=102285 RepID=A0A0R3TKE4_RODNA|nr:unnamed protein product [Rodentolepis nana]
MSDHSTVNVFSKLFGSINRNEEEPEIKKVKKEQSIFIDEDTQKKALYGSIGGALAGLVVGGLTEAISSGLGQTFTTTTNAVEQMTEVAEVPFSQSTNIVDDILDLIKRFVENDRNVSEDKEPLINHKDAGVQDEEQRPIKEELPDINEGRITMNPSMFRLLRRKLISSNS